MAQVLRQSTQVIVVIGPFVDVGDGFTPETAVALTTADEAEILKANTTTTTDISGATWAAITGADGYYGLTLTTSHTDTVGPLTVIVQDDSVCLPVFARFQVVEENVYDMLYASGGDLGTTVDAILTDTAEIGAAGAGLTALATQASVNTIDGIVDAILIDTAEIGAAGAGLTEAGGTGDHLTAIPWNAAWDAEVQSECTDALNAYDPPTKAEVDALLTNTMTEAYACAGAEFSPAQALYMIWSAVGQFSISGTTLTSYQLDACTTAMTFTLDDDTNPTSRVRAT